MKYLIALALVAIFAADIAQPATLIPVNCGEGVSAVGENATNLHGNWDVLFDAAGTPNFGLLSIGLIDGAYGGS